jgi:hypothetical protein
MFFEYLSAAIALTAACRDDESFAYIFHIPESKCAFLEIFNDPPVDHGVDSGEIRAEQWQAFVPCV